MMVPTWVPPSLTALRAFETAARTLSFPERPKNLIKRRALQRGTLDLLDRRDQSSTLLTKSTLGLVGGGGRRVDGNHDQSRAL